MKILITTDLYHTATNGVVVSVCNLCEELRKRGHDVRILTLSENKKSYCRNSVYYIASFSLEKVYPGVRGSLDFRNSYIVELIDWSPDVIHSQCEFFTFEFAKRISQKVNAPIVHTYHTLYEQYSRYVISNEAISHFLIRKLMKWRLKDTSVIIVPSEKTEKVLKNYGIEKRICIIPTGISLEQHYRRITQEKRQAMRKEYAISNDEFVLLSLGRLGAEKGIQALLHYFSQVYKESTNLKLLIVGDGPERENLEKLALNLKLGSAVVFAGMVDPDEVQMYYQLGDVFVSASTSETQGLTYAEAAANGLPLVCMRDSCLRGILSTGLNGYMFSSPEEFRSAIFALKNDRGLWKQASMKSVEMASRFDKPFFAKSVERVYQSVLD